MNVRKIVQLSLVHVGVSLTVVPITGTLNRIMIADMGIPAVLVGILVALPYLLSPLQVLVGNWADQRPLWGLHRAPWILIGGLMAAFGSYLAAHTVFYMDVPFLPGLLASTSSAAERAILAIIVDKIIAVHITPTVAVRQPLGDPSVSSLASDR